MKNLVVLSVILSFIFYAGCSSNSDEDDPGVDCSQSDLAIEIAESTNPDCDVDGSITVSGSGGTEPYSYSLNGVDFQSSTVFNDLSASTYTVIVKDADGCTKQTSFNLQAGPNGITVNISSKTTSSCLDATGSIQISASGGDEDFMYSLDGGSSQQSNVFNLVSTGDHTITVSDGTGCTASIDTYLESNVSLSGDIMPLLQAQCTFSGCHNGDNGADRNWLQKEDILAKAENIKSRTQSGSMPRSPGVLTQDQIDLIACWVDDGAKDN